MRKHPGGGGIGGGVHRSICLCDGSLTFVASPSFWNSEITAQVASYCHHSRPCRALNSNAWWLLCQPSPNARMPTHLQQSHLESEDQERLENQTFSPFSEFLLQGEWQAGSKRMHPQGIIKVIKLGVRQGQAVI